MRIHCDGVEGEGTLNCNAPVPMGYRYGAFIITKVVAWEQGGRGRGLGIKALMVDVDGVLVDGRPEDGCPWHTSVEVDLGFTSETLHEQFFTPCWENIVLGRAGLMEHLTPALQK